MSQQLQMKKTERKISDISSEEASNVISLLKCMVADLDPQEEGDDVVTTSANKIIEKPSEQKVCSCIKLLAVFSCVFFYQALASSDPATLGLSFCKSPPSIWESPPHIGTPALPSSRPVPCHSSFSGLIPPLHHPPLPPPAPTQPAPRRHPSRFGQVSPVPRMYP